MHRVVYLIAALLLVAAGVSIVTVAPAPAQTEGATVANLAPAYGWPGMTMNQMNGELCAPPNKCVGVGYLNTAGTPAIDDCIAKVERWLDVTPGDKMIVGMSLGGLCVHALARKWLTDPHPKAYEVSELVAIATPDRRDTGRAWFNLESDWYYGNDTGVGAPVNTMWRLRNVCRDGDSWCWWLGRHTGHANYKPLSFSDPHAMVEVTGNVEWWMYAA